MAKQTPTADAGAGLIATVFGALVFLVLLLFAVQVLVGLYARSVVSAAASDAALEVAGGGAYGDAGGQEVNVEAAEATARSRLGTLGSHAIFTWREVSADQVVLEVRVKSPQFLPVRFTPLDMIDRTVTVRTERFR